MKNNQHLHIVYILSYAKNGGIYIYTINDSGMLTYMDKVSLDNALYMAISDRTLYVLLQEPFESSKESGLISFEIEGNGELANPSEIVSTKGQEACHLVVGIPEKSIYCANYISGAVTKMDGEIITHEGHSIHPIRQTAPHPHNVAITPDNLYICAVDLGMDQILVYDRQMNFISSVKVPEGHGPRHMVFSPNGNYAFCANELKSTVTAFSYNEGRLTRMKTYSTLPEEYKDDNFVAAIRISSDGRHLYVSNRGNDSIACFRVKNDQLIRFDIVGCGGKFPRDFNITPCGTFMICTNENSNNITVFKINKTTGCLKMINEIENITNPLCVVFIRVNDLTNIRSD